MCTVLLPPGDNAIAVNKYIISYIITLCFIFYACTVIQTLQNSVLLHDHVDFTREYFTFYILCYRIIGLSVEFYAGEISLRKEYYEQHKEVTGACVVIPRCGNSSMV